MVQTYTCSMWIVHEGREQEFLEAFQRFTDRATRDFGAREGVILRDADDPRRFIVVRRWEDAGSLESWAAAEDSRVLGEAWHPTVVDGEAYITTKVADLG